MRKILMAVLTLLLAFPIAASAQGGGTTSKTTTAGTAAPKKRGPVFRATKDQINQAQTILKQRGFYGGGQTGKLDTDTRAGLKKYQEAEGVKVTGTLNKMTLEKMNITLTDRQRTM